MTDQTFFNIFPEEGPLTSETRWVIQIFEGINLMEATAVPFHEVEDILIQWREKYFL